MSMLLLELSKKDIYWRKIALKICKDKMLADDLVNDMYLALANNKKQINDFYVIVTIKNLFLQHLKNNKFTDLKDNLTIEQPFELDDKEKYILENMYWVAKEYLLLTDKLSLRKIGEMLNTDYSFIFKTIKKEKEKWKK